MKFLCDLIIIWDGGYEESKLFGSEYRNKTILRKTVLTIQCGLT